MSDWIEALPNPTNPQVIPGVRLFGILGTWMEADIVAANIRNALVQGCERVYLVDNASPDDTVEVATAAGAILARSFTTTHYDEYERMRHMNSVVAEVSEAEADEHLWWLFLDADEFAHGPSGLTLLEYLRTLDQQFRVVGARYINHYPGARPHYQAGSHPIDFQPLAEEWSYPMCRYGHRKHPLQRYDKGGPGIECGRGFHMAQCEAQLYEPAQPIFLHHFPFREEQTTRHRLEQLWKKNESGLSRALETDDATGHMLPRMRSLDAVYGQDWARVENFIASSIGVSPKPWTELVEAEHHAWRVTSSMRGVWKYEDLPRFNYGDDTTYRKGIAFLDGHGTIEDWGCGFCDAKSFITNNPYVGIDGSSPAADKIVDLTEYRSDVDCVFMRHVLEHNMDWRDILAGAVSSFRKRMVLILFTPFAETTRVITSATHVTSVPVPDIAFRKEDLTDYFKEYLLAEESLTTDTQYGVEHIFYLEKAQTASASRPIEHVAGATPSSSVLSETHAPVVSAVVIFFNELPFLEQAIASVRDQTFSQWELLLIDDGSDDGSTEIAKAAAKDDPERVRYFEHPDHVNLGMSASRNLGVLHARGEYVAFLDADDVWLPQKLEHQVELLSGRPEIDMVYGDAQWWYSWTGRAEDVSRDCQRGVGLTPGAVFTPPELATTCSPLGSAPSPAMCSFLIRRIALERVGGCETTFRGMFEDQALLSKLYLSATILVSDECVARYRVHEYSCVSSSVTSGEVEQRTHTFLQWLGEYISRSGIVTPAIKRALRKALYPYRHPRLHALGVRLGQRTDQLGHDAWMASNRLLRAIARKSTGTLAAQPNPIPVSGRFAQGTTQLAWHVKRATSIEVRLNAPAGVLVARSHSSGSTQTGPWVEDGMRFYLQDVSNGLPLTKANTIAAVRITTRREQMVSHAQARR